MRNFMLSTVSCIALVSPAVGEVVKTTDGRSIELKDDGTYTFIETAPASQDDFVSFKEPFFERDVSEYGQESIQFMPIFVNTSEKRIVGLKFQADFADSFGDVKVSFNGDTEEPFSPGETSTNILFYNFKNNQFIDGEIYDKLLSMVTNKSGSINVQVKTIVFEGGEIVNLTTE